MTSFDELRALHRQALNDVTALLADVAPTDLDRATPCAGWDLRALVGHMIGQNHGFAEATAAGDAAPGAFRSRPPQGPGLRADWATSADALALAFGQAPPDRRVRLVELSPDVRFAVTTVVGFQLIDTVVHAWDVARSLGRAYRPGADLVAAALPIARQVPDGEPRRRPGAAFAPALPPPDDDGWDAVLALLGRDAAGDVTPGRDR